MSPPLRWDQLALHMSNLAIVRQKHEEGEQASKFTGYADYLLDNARAWSYLTCSSVASWRTSDIHCKRDLGFRILRLCSAVSGESIQSQNLQVLNPLSFHPLDGIGPVSQPCNPTRISKQSCGTPLLLQC